MSGTILIGDCRDTLQMLESGSVQCVVTSPPYFGLRDYGVDGQLGLEPTPDEFVAAMVEVFREVRRVLRDDGTLWLNLGDSYNNAGSSRNGEGLDGYRRGGATGPDGAAGYKKRDMRYALREHGIKHKDLIGIPWRVAFALQADGWYLRQDIIWHKPNPMPESVRDRCTKAHEYIFLLTKKPKYYFDGKAIEEPVKWERWGNQTENKKHTGTAGHLGGKTLAELPIRDKKNKRSVWSVSTKPFKGAHFATFPPDLIEPCILAGCPEAGVVLDPFFGAGTTALVAQQHGRNWIGCELNHQYVDIAKRRLGILTDEDNETDQFEAMFQ